MHFIVTLYCLIPKTNDKYYIVYYLLTYFNLVHWTTIFICVWLFGRIISWIIIYISQYLIFWNYMSIDIFVSLISWLHTIGLVPGKCRFEPYEVLLHNIYHEFLLATSNRVSICKRHIQTMLGFTMHHFRFYQVPFHIYKLPIWFHPLGL
jgi:hypothetical protein